MCCCKKKKHKRSRPRPCPLTINRRNLKTAIASQGESSSSKDVAEETTCISNTEVRKHRKKVTDSEDTTASKSCKSSKKVERKVKKLTVKEKKKSKNSKTVREDAKSIQQVLNVRGHQVDAKQIQPLLQKKETKGKITAKTKQGDTIYELPSNNKKKKGRKKKKYYSEEEEVTDRPDVLNEKTAEGTVDSDTPIANNKDSDEEGEEVTEKNYMYNEKEILYVNREMLSEGPLDCILDGFDDDERARSIEMLPKIPHIVWDPFQPLEKLEDDVREFLFSCQYLRRSSLLSHTSTMPKAPKPPRAKPHARIVTLNKKILSLDAFKRPKVEITEEEIEPSTCTGNCSQKTTSDKRSNKGSLGRTRTSTKTSRDESCDSA